MQIPWDVVSARLADLEAKLQILQGAGRVKVQREYAQLQKVIDLQKRIQSIDVEIANIEQAMCELKSNDLYLPNPIIKSDVALKNNINLDELVGLYLDEKHVLMQEREKLSLTIEDLLVPADPNDDNSVFLEIRAGTGGQEAALFAADLVNMYTAYALKKGWKVSVIDESKTDLQGFREITLSIEGVGVYKHLKFEGGVHRVQRVPKTETQGRIHTSTATVAVLPDVSNEVDVAINPADLRIDVYRASGAGGQHVNTTDSAVRITHIPTGVVVACQDERSQHKNKAKAMKVLQARLVAHEQEKQDAELGEKRKAMIGRGTRSEKVRTYNFPQNRITDHTIDLTLKKLDYVIEGDLDDLINPLIHHEKEERKKDALAFGS